MSRSIDVVFLDAGETILHAHPSFPELFASTCRQHGIEVSPADVEPVLFSMVRNMAEVADEAGVSNPSLSPEGSRAFWTFLYRRCLAAFDVVDETIEDELYRVFSDVSTYRLYEDALPAIESLKARGYRLGLISNFEEWLEELLVELQVGELFDVSVISGIAGVEKPDVRIYEIALELAGVEAGRAVHVGDSLRLDVEPARAAGMHAVFLDRSVKYHDIDCPTIATLEELPAVVENL